MSAQIQVPMLSAITLEGLYLHIAQPHQVQQCKSWHGKEATCLQKAHHSAVSLTWTTGSGLAQALGNICSTRWRFRVCRANKRCCKGSTRADLVWLAFLTEWPSIPDGRPEHKGSRTYLPLYLLDMTSAYWHTTACTGAQIL